VFAPPAVAGDLVFVGSCSGTFYALDWRTGEQRWSYDIRQDGKQISFHGAILIDKNRVLFDTDRSCDADGIGHVYAADQGSGRILWKYRSPVGVSANLLRTRSSVCFGTTSAEWGCLDPTSGAVRWKVAPLPGKSACEMPVWADSDGERLFVVASDGAVVALRASNGEVLWKRWLGARATTSPLVARGVLHLGAADDRVYSLEATTGRVLHSLSVSGRPVGRPTVAREGLFFLIERTTKPKGRLVALDPTGRQLKWFREHDRTFASEQPHVWRDVIVAADCAGAVSAFSVADGTSRWQMNVTGCVRSIGSSRELLFFGAQEGMVYAVRP